MKKLLLFGFVASVALVVSAHADLSVKVADKEPPKEIGESIRALLQTKAVQVLDGDKPAFEFWFAKEIPLKSKPDSLAKALDTLDQTTVLGAVSVGTTTRDYRDDELPAGVYTVRFALQQQDGNHSGSSDFIYFAVLVPAANDPKPDTFTAYKALVKASAKGTTAEHPHVMSLRPASAEAGDQPKITEPAPEHKSILLKLPAKAGSDKTSLTFEYVVEGHVKH